MSLPTLILIAGLTSTVAPSAVSSTITADASSPAEEVVSVRPEDARGWEVRPGVEPEDVFLFVPRLIFTPVRWTVAAVSWPLRKLMIVTEEYKVVEHTIDFLYNDARTAGVLPVFAFLPSSGGSVGAKAFHHDLFGYEEKLEASGRYGGTFQQSYDLRFAADRLYGTALWLELQGRYEIQPRLYFSGLGNLEPATTISPDRLLAPTEAHLESRFRQERYLARARFGRAFGPERERLKVGASVIYNHRRFFAAEGLRASERSIETVYDTSLINGFDRGVDLFELTGDLVIDFRDREGFTSRGFYFEAFAGGAPPHDGYGFWHYGAEGIVYIDLFQRSRVLVFRAGIEAVEGSDDDIPFSELPRLGGVNVLRGYPVDTYRDEKAVFATVEYRWRVHEWIEANIFGDLGRVAHSYTDFAKAEGWRFGGGGGLSLGGNDGRFLSLEVAYGSELRVFLGAEILAFADRTEDL